MNRIENEKLATLDLPTVNEESSTAVRKRFSSGRLQLFIITLPLHYRSPESKVSLLRSVVTWSSRSPYQRKGPNQSSYLDYLSNSSLSFPWNTNSSSCLQYWRTFGHFLNFYLFFNINFVHNFIYQMFNHLFIY